MQVLASSFADELRQATTSCQVALCEESEDDSDYRQYTPPSPKYNTVTRSLSAILERPVLAAFDQECGGEVLLPAVSPR